MNKKYISTVLALLMLLPMILAACSDSPVSGGDVTESMPPQTQPDEVEEYGFPDVKYDDAEFTILSTGNTWGFISDILVDTIMGEPLNDEIYKRNALIEETFGVKLVEVQFPMNDVEAKVRTTLQAGGDEFDAMFFPGLRYSNVGTLISEGLLHNLNDVPELRLDEPWWDQKILDVSRVGSGDKLFFASNDINVFCMQAPMCMFFNENMIEDLGLDLPYDLVREGKWTVDKLTEYIKAGTLLNGDASFAWNNNGDSVYGYATWNTGISGMIFGSGEQYIKTDSNNMPYFSPANNERFINVCAKLASIMNTPGEYIYANTPADGMYYEYMLRDGRAIFINGELKSADNFRDMESTFGIAPMPKHDENQDSYYSLVTQHFLLTLIPITNNDTAKAGVILDAMAYLSYKNITPTFFETTIAQKRLRNKDSIEMLEIIRETKTFNIGWAYGWLGSFYGDIPNNLQAGGNNVASIVEKYKTLITNNISRTMDYLNG